MRGAGSVLRSALSFGRHSRQPFGDRPRYATVVASSLVALLFGALTAPAPLRFTGLPFTASPRLLRVPHFALPKQRP